MKSLFFSKNMMAILVTCMMATAALFVSCSTKNDPATSKLSNKPEALAVNDNSSAGIVKGVLVGSTGVFKFSIKNGNDSIYCRVTFDGNTGMLYTTSMTNWQPGQPINATFTGMVGGVNVSASFSCNQDGTSPFVIFTIPGHDVTVNLYKETSTNQVKGYEGTYTSVTVSTGEKIGSGTFNFILCNGIVLGTRSSPQGNGFIMATVTGSKMTFTSADSTNGETLDIDDNGVSGTIFTAEDHSEKTTVQGKRTL